MLWMFFGMKQQKKVERAQSRPVERDQMEESFQSTKGRLRKREGKGKFSWPWGSFLLFLSLAFVLSSCATGPPPPLPAPALPAPGGGGGGGGGPIPPTGPTRLIFQVDLNDSGRVTTLFNTGTPKTYLGTYRIVINTLNTALIGNQTAVTTSPDTWTDYFQFDLTGWTRNHRIAPPNAPQPQQWTGFQVITPGSISPTGNSFTLTLSLPDTYLGSATLFNASIITYIAPQTNPSDLHPIDALGPTIISTSPIDYLTFNVATSMTNSKADTGGLGDWATYPADFPDLVNSNYINYDVKAFTVTEQ